MTNAWTIPRTWTDGEVVGKTIMDAHIRDNMEHLYDRVQDGRSRGWSYGNECLGVPTDGTMSAQVSGGTATVVAPLANVYERPGQIKLDTGAVATNRAALATANFNQIALGGGEVTFECVLQISALSSGTNRFQLLAGLIDNVAAANQTNGAYLLYDEGGVSTGSTAAAYWQTASVAGAARTFNTALTQVTVAATTWVNLKLIVNATRTNIAYYVNGTQVSAHTANIPANTTGLGFGVYLQKSIGTTARFVTVDYVRVGQYLTTAR